MKMIRQGLLPITLMLAGFAPLTQAHGLPGHGLGGTNVAERATQAAVSRDGISLDEAVSRAEAQYHARVVRTDVQDEDGRTVYVLKLLSEDGRVFTVRIDAATGRMR
ncbi:MAG: PepSY domain-containing protein [Pseudomonadota bacterium]